MKIPIRPGLIRLAAVLAAVLPLVFPAGAPAQALGPESLAARFAGEVTLRLQVPADEQRRYGRSLLDALDAAGVSDATDRYVLLIDRSPAVQAALVFFIAERGEPYLVGATRASTGKPGAYDYFHTPLGVFVHTPDNMDFRAKGTFNELGIRGYGVAGMRVFDFGWQLAERSWDLPARSPMRLQVHATDPVLEKYLGRVRSKGCIRIPATLNVFLDRYGILDAEYEARAAAGVRLWVLRADRIPVPGAGRYLVIVDSGRKSRPTWSP
jgi:hypothetical protein